jgi:hypothetical protein
MKLLTSSDYFDTALLETVRSAEGIMSRRKGFEKGIRVQFEDVGGCYGFSISKTFDKLTSYTYKQLRQWINEGDIVDAAEHFINVYKSTYGVKPRVGTPKQWRDINWLRYMTHEITCEL